MVETLILTPTLTLTLTLTLTPTPTLTLTLTLTLELQAAKRMYAAYCAGSPPPAEPEVCTNEILKKTLGGPAEMVPFAKG